MPCKPGEQEGNHHLRCERQRDLFALWLIVLLLGGLALARADTHTNLQILWNFPNTTGDPFAPVIEGSDGRLYGTTYGVSDVGGVFRIDKSGSNFMVLHQFTNSQGDTPSAPLIEATNGILYGTTWLDGSNGAGSLFQINKDSSGFAVIHYFNYATNDGASPVAGLLQASDGALYGTAQYGGTGDASTGGDGVVFRWLIGETNITILHSFVPAEGYNPQAALIEGTNGALYGTTLSGGLSNAGTIFRIDKGGTNFQVVYNFSGTNGKFPSSSLLAGAPGKLYGTASEGGLYNHGVVFSLDYNGSNYTVLHHFGAATNDGNQPLSAVVQGSDGTLYGTTYFSGMAFALNPDGSGFYSVLQQFAGTNGGAPNGLLLGSDGNIYGTCNDGGPNNRGTVYRLSGLSSDHDLLAVPQNLGGTNWLLSGHGTANRIYTLQFTTNVAPSAVWYPLGSATADVNGYWQFTDASNSPPRFYRSSFP